MSTTGITRLAGVVLLGLAWAACGGGESGGGEAAASEDTSALATDQPAPAAGGQEQGNVQLPEGVTQAMVDEGNQLFNGAGTCFACHGQGGVGTTLGPNLTDDEWLNIEEPTIQNFVQLINTGVPEPEQFPGVMLPRAGANLTDDQVRSLAAYVYTLSQGG